MTIVADGNEYLHVYLKNKEDVVTLPEWVNDVDCPICVRTAESQRADLSNYIKVFSLETPEAKGTVFLFIFFSRPGFKFYWKLLHQWAEFKHLGFREYFKIISNCILTHFYSKNNLMMIMYGKDLKLNAMPCQYNH